MEKETKNTAIDTTINNEQNNPDSRPKPRRNPDGTFVKGFSGNPGGRRTDTLKNYDRERFKNMFPWEKEKFLSKVSHETRYRMAEGNPHNTGETEIKIPDTLIGLIKHGITNQTGGSDVSGESA